VTLLELVQRWFQADGKTWANVVRVVVTFDDGTSVDVEKLATLVTGTVPVGGKSDA